jgi:perosamine synthetase
MSELEAKYITEVISSQFSVSSGASFMMRLEAAFAKRFSVPSAIAFVNGTATMHAALEAAGVGVGDEVIVPPLTMSSTSLAVLQSNATPVFADVDRETFQICPNAILDAITEKTKAVIVVALYGGSPDLPKIRQICDQRGLVLIEDNAECFLGENNGKLVGQYGDFSSFSFQSTKHLTSGEGGILLCRRKEDAQSVRSIQSLGYRGLSADKAKITKEDIQNPNFKRHGVLGWNYRMPELCCAVALAQTERIDELVSQRVRVGKIFAEALSEFEGKVISSQKNYENTSNTYWCYAFSLNTDVITWDEFRRLFLSLGGDPFYAAWSLSYLEPMFIERNFLGREKFISEHNLSKYQRGLCPIAEEVQPKIVQLKTNYWNIDDALKQANLLRTAMEQACV